MFILSGGRRYKKTPFRKTACGFRPIRSTISAQLTEWIVKRSTLHSVDGMNFSPTQIVMENRKRSSVRTVHAHYGNTGRYRRKIDRTFIVINAIGTFVKFKKERFSFLHRRNEFFQRCHFNWGIYAFTPDSYGAYIYEYLRFFFYFFCIKRISVCEWTILYKTYTFCNVLSTYTESLSKFN